MRFANSLFAFFLLSLSHAELLSVVRTAPWQYHFVDGLRNDSIAAANFSDQINLSGWTFLSVYDTRQGGAVADEEVAYVAGMLEAKLTGPLLLMHWKNTMAGYCSSSSPPSPYCDKLKQFLSENNDFVTEQIAKEDSDYWYQVNLFNRQLAGLRDGYATLGLEKIPDNGFLMMQISGDLEDLESALGGGAGSHVLGSGSCSALIKLLPGNSELFVSHDTWDNYSGMLRTFKLYDFKFKTSKTNAAVIPGHRQAFSSYPGRILSGDDFYLLSSGLVTMETTTGNSNPDLWKHVSPQAVLEGVRSVVANRLATSGKEWTDTFALHNSGTYNNQWMVVDYKLFERGVTELSDGLLWVLEQLPGMIHADDQTEMLRKQAYWPSFNIPYYPDIFEQSGTAKLAKQYGEWFTWNGSPRAKIFARNHTAVTNTASMIALMRYNNFQHDDLSRCNCTPPYSGENAISARSDLNPASGSYPFSALGHRSHGGTDNKMTSSELFARLSCKATSGPTFDQQPAFQWSTSGFPRPLGHPDKWNFPPVLVQWSN